jgi:hypothetical protein
MAYIPTAGLRYNVEPDVVRIAGIYNLPLLQRLVAQKFTVKTRQRLIKWNIDAAYGTVTSQASSANAPSSSADTVATASLGIGDNRIIRPFTIANNEMTEALQIGVGEVQNLLKFNMQTAIEAILQDLAGQLYTATANSGISAGLADLVAAATSSLSTVTYAGLAPGTYAKWSNVYKANAGTGRALTIALLRGLVTDMKAGTTLGTSANPTALYMSPTLVDTYKALFDSKQIINYNSPAGTGNPDAYFEGIPVIGDPKAPAGKVFAVSEPQLAIYSFEHTDAMGTVTEATKDQGGLSFYVSEIASSNPEARNFTVSINPQFVVRNRAAVAVLGDLS